LFQVFEKQTAEQARKYPHGEKETRAAGNPLEVGTNAAAGDNEVDVGVMEQVLPPGVQYAEEPISAPRCLGSRAMVSSAWAAARKRMPYTAALL
jgi:hypothetical protein